MSEYIENTSKSTITDIQNLTTTIKRYPTVVEFLEIVPILEFDIEGYITDVKGQKDWSADAIADFATRLGIETHDLKSEILGEGEDSEWKIRAEVMFIDTGYKEIAEITQPRHIEKTNYETKEKYIDDDNFSIEKAGSRAIRNAKKRAMPAKRLLHMFFAAKQARGAARNELRGKIGFYKDNGLSPRDLTAFAEKTFSTRENRDLSQRNWQEKHWEEFKTGIADGSATSDGLFSELILSTLKAQQAEEYPETNDETGAAADSGTNSDANTSTDSDPSADSDTDSQASIPDAYGSE